MYLFQKVPPEVAGESVEYERAVGELVIMVAPLAPMYAAEMWEGLRQVGTIRAFNWVGLHWPIVFRLIHEFYLVLQCVQSVIGQPAYCYLH